MIEAPPHAVHGLGNIPWEALMNQDIDLDDRAGCVIEILQE